MFFSLRETNAKNVASKKIEMEGKRKALDIFSVLKKKQLVD